MNIPLRTNNKEFQSFENLSHLEECTAHEKVKQVGVRGLVPSYSAYLDQYLGGDGEMHLHVGWLDKRPIGMRHSIGRPIGGEVIRDYCIVVKNLRLSIQVTMVRDRLGETTCGKVNGAVFPTATKGNKSTMLISIFQAADKPQGDDICENPKIIRLQLYDECPSFRMQPLDGTFKPISSVGIIDHEVTINVLSEDVLKQDWEARTLSALFGDTGDNNIIKGTS